MTTRNLRALLVEAEAELNTTELPRDTDRRLRSRLFERRSFQLRPWMWSLAAACALLIVAVNVLHKPTATMLDGFVVASSSGDAQIGVRPDRAIEVSRGSCTLVDEAMGETISVSAPATLRRQSDGLRVIAGVVEVSVNKRSAGAPSVQVLVSHGAIEVVGTRFTVVQEAQQGAVTLHEGEIRFHDLRGGSRALAPGERLEWPPPAPPVVEQLPAVPSPTALVTRPKRTSKPPSADPIVFRDPEDLLQQVDVLRSRGLFSEAARYLAHGLSSPLRPATRERFSYELGSILTYQLDDSKAACAHWVDHARRYPAGRYQTEVMQAAAQAGCEGPAR